MFIYSLTSYLMTMGGFCVGGASGSPLNTCCENETINPAAVKVKCIDHGQTPAS